jgi:hypothetical protein
MVEGIYFGLSKFKYLSIFNYKMMNKQEYENWYIDKVLPKMILVVIVVLLLNILFSCSIYRIVPKTFEGETTFSCDFKNESDLSKFTISDNEDYNNGIVAFIKEMVSVDPNKGLVLKSQKQAGKWVAGCIKTEQTFTQKNGTWIFNANFPDSWSAIWLLRPGYFVPSINRDHIIPEIDIAENNGGKIDNCVHYGYPLNPNIYRLHGRVKKMHKPDGKFHEYTVQFKEKGYDFYLDGKLKNRMRSNDPEFVADQPCYMLINNAWSDRHPEIETEFVVRNLKVLK